MQIIFKEMLRSNNKIFKLDFQEFVSMHSQPSYNAIYSFRIISKPCKTKLRIQKQCDEKICAIWTVQIY